MNKTSLRTDAHRPSVLEPADYEYVGFTDSGGRAWEGAVNYGEQHGYSEWAKDFDYDAERSRINKIHPGGCDSCGANNLRYRGYYRHVPTGDVIVLGIDCMEKMEFESREVMVAKKRSAAYFEQQLRVKAVYEWADLAPENAEAHEFLSISHAQGSSHEFLMDVRDKLYRFGRLSERQVAAVLRIKTPPVSLEEQLGIEPAPVIEGRIGIEGTVLAQKAKETIYGVIEKMLVLDDRGFKIWVTAPESILSALSSEQHALWNREAHESPEDYPTTDTLKTRRVKFMAKVTRSDRDETFGFGSRPSKGELVPLEKG